MIKTNKLFTACLISLAVLAAPSFAKEPMNLALSKAALINYHDSGEYAKDIDQAASKALDLLKLRLSDKHNDKLAIVLDIDETSLSNYANMKALGFGGSLKQIMHEEKKGNDPAIQPILNLYQFAKANNVAVFFITGRHPDERASTEKNLIQVGYKNWDGLFFKPKMYWDKSAALYKTKVRKEITELGYRIVLNVGDQQSDLEGGYAEKQVKLPGPFYLIS